MIVFVLGGVGFSQEDERIIAIPVPEVGVAIPPKPAPPVAIPVPPVQDEPRKGGGLLKRLFGKDPAPGIEPIVDLPALPDLGPLPELPPQDVVTDSAIVATPAQPVVVPESLPVTTVETISESGTALSEAVAQALRLNPAARAALLGSRASLMEVDASFGPMFPTATLSGTSGPTWRSRRSRTDRSTGDWLYQDELMLSVQQQIYDGRATKNRIAAARSRVSSSRMNEGETKEEVALATAEIFLNLLRNQQLISVSERNVEAHEQGLEDAKIRAVSGSTQTEVELVTGRLNLARDTLEARKTALELAEVGYRRYIGCKPGKLKTPVQPVSIPDCLAGIDVSKNWTYREAIKVADALQADARVAMAANRPRVDFEATNGLGYDSGGTRGKNHQSSFLVVGEWAIFDRGRHSTIKASELRAAEARAEAEEALKVAEQQAGEAWADIRGAARRIEVLEAYLEKIGRVLMDYQEQFLLGKRPFLNVLDIQNERFRAESSLIETRFQKRISEYRFLATTARLKDHLSGRRR